MKTMKMLAMGSLLVVGLLAVGCKKEVNLTFVNPTDKALDLRLTTPEEGTEYLGTLPPQGGKIKTKVKIDEEDLPTNLTYRAGEFTGSIPVSKQSPNSIWVDVDSGRVRDKKTTVHEERKTEIKEVPLKQETVVE